MGNFKCAVCGEITWCHTGPDTLEKQINELKEKVCVLQNENRDDQVARDDVHPKVVETDTGQKPSDSLRIQQLRRLKRGHRPRK
jgi:hypothetical protein